MLHQAKGIVLTYIRFRETSLITRIYTERQGLVSFIAQGVRQARSTMPQGLFQPLTQLDVQWTEKQSARPDPLFRLSSAHIAYPYHQIGLHFPHTAVAFYLGELLSYSLREDIYQEGMFSFIENSCQILDLTQEGLPWFSLQFLMSYSRLLGFGLETAEQLQEALKESPYWQTLVKQGMATVSIPLFENLQIMTLGDGRSSEMQTEARITTSDRRALLQQMTAYVCLHLPGMPFPRSIQTLQDIFK
jgi:DNA repair protein RecO (recombination protein O)